MSDSGKNRKLFITLVLLDILLVSAPAALSLVRGLDFVTLLPGFIIIILVVHFWSARSILLNDIDQRIELARLRHLANPDDGEFSGEIDRITISLFKKLQHLQNGSLYLDGDAEYWQYAHRSLADARGNVAVIDINSDPNLLPYWNSDRFSQYYEDNLRIIESQRTFTRVFVLDKNHTVDDSGRIRSEVLAVLRKQSEGGIQVYVTWVETLLSQPRIDLTDEYLLFYDVRGQCCKAIYAPVPHGDPYYEKGFVTKSPEILERLQQKHDEVLRRSFRYDELQAVGFDIRKLRRPSKTLA